MLHDVYLDAIKNRERKIATISDTDSKNKRILELEKDSWTEYAPQTTTSVLAGVDSSYNRQQFQGFHLYVVDAAAVGNDGSVIAKEFTYGMEVIDQGQLESRSMEMETRVAANAAGGHDHGDVDLVLIDGPMTSRFVSGSVSSSALQSLTHLVNEHDNIVFLSKTSDSQEIYGKMGSRVGDIYFFNHASSRAGYSRPYPVRRYTEPVTYVYARLADYTPVVKLEVPGEVGERDVEGILDRIAYGSVSGYPYVLQLAHNTALVSDNDIARLGSLYGLKNEIGARQVLR